MTLEVWSKARIPSYYGTSRFICVTKDSREQVYPGRYKGLDVRFPAHGEKDGTRYERVIGRAQLLQLHYTARAVLYNMLGCESFVLHFIKKHASLYLMVFIKCQISHDLFAKCSYMENQEL